jgi:hypothetical protein
MAGHANSTYYARTREISEYGEPDCRMVEFQNVSLTRQLNYR